MAKGFFTQCVVILLAEPVALADVRRCLEKNFRIVKENAAAPEWAMGGPSLLVAYDEAVNGYALVDLMDRPWPDSMGDPKTSPSLFGAWAMGYFGPYAFPNGLQRACEQTWSWNAAKDSVAQHAACIRIKLSYALGAPDHAPVMPANCDPVAELQFASAIAQTLLTLPQALCYFNPGGEVLLDAAGLDASITFARERKQLPLDAWVNVRLYQGEAGWVLMDTVGAEQLDLSDLTAVFPGQGHAAPEVGNFLRDVTLYLHGGKAVMREGDTVGGPGGVNWVVRAMGDCVATPPRPTIHLAPAGHDVPASMLPRTDVIEAGAQAAKRPWWKRLVP